MDILWIDLNHDTVLDITDGGLLPQVLAQHPSTTVPATDSAWYCCTSRAAKDNSLSIAEGALFNARMLGEDLYGHNDGSKGVHNPALYKGLIAGSINAVSASTACVAVLSPSQEAAVQKALSAPGDQVHGAERRCGRPPQGEPGPERAHLVLISPDERSGRPRGGRFCWRAGHDDHPRARASRCRRLHRRRDAAARRDHADRPVDLPEAALGDVGRRRSRRPGGGGPCCGGCGATSRGCSTTSAPGAGP